MQPAQYGMGNCISPLHKDSHQRNPSKTQSMENIKYNVKEKILKTPPEHSSETAHAPAHFHTGAGSAWMFLNQQV